MTDVADLVDLESVVLVMTADRARVFGGRVRDLQEAWGMASVVDTVERAVAECRQTAERLDGGS